MKENGLSRSIMGNPRNLKTALHDNETVEITVELSLNSNESYGKPFKRTLHICTNVEEDKGNFKGRHKCFWAGKPTDSPGLSRNFREGHIKVEDGKLVTLQYVSYRFVYGSWRWVHQYYTLRTEDGEWGVRI